MNYIEPILQKTVSIKNMIEEIVNTQIYLREDKIRNWIRERWLTGKDSNGNLIGFYRNEDYAEYKNALNSFAGFGNVDLTLSGAMGRSIEIIGFGGEYEIFSNVVYYNEIIDKYGELNFNITDNEREILFNEIWNVIFNELNEAYA